MLFHGLLDDLFRTPTSVPVLRVLVRHPSKEFSGRELARLAEVAPSKAIRQLETLRAHGLVHRRTAGRTHLWKVSQEHLLFGELRRLFQLERQALGDLEKLLRKGLAGLKVSRLVLFGSLARGEERPDSDIDLLVVVPTARDKERALSKLLTLSHETFERFGNGLSPILYTAREAASRRESELMRSIEREGIELGGRA